MIDNYFAIRLKESRRNELIRKVKDVDPDTKSADVYGTPFKNYLTALQGREILYYYGTVTTMEGNQRRVFPLLFTRPKQLLETADQARRRFNAIQGQLKSRASRYKGSEVIPQYSENDLEVVEFRLVEVKRNDEHARHKSSRQQKVLWLASHPEMWHRHPLDIKDALVEAGLVSAKTYVGDLRIATLVEYASQINNQKV